MVLESSPDSRAMFRKFTPMLGVAAGTAGFSKAARDRKRPPSRGPTPAKRFSTERTSAERLRDSRKLRRGEDNRNETFLKRVRRNEFGYFAAVVRATLWPFLL